MRTTRIAWSAVLVCAALLALIQRAPAQDLAASPYASVQTANKEDMTALAFSSDGKTLAAGDDDGKILIWSVENKRPLATLEMPSTVQFLGFLSGDKDVIAVDKKGNVSILNLLKAAATTTFRTKGNPVRTALDAGKQLLAVATGDDRVELFDLKAGMPHGSIEAKDLSDDLLFLGFDRPGQQLVAISKKGTVVGWSPATLRKLREVTLQSGELHGSRSVVHSAATNRSANVLVVGIEEVVLPQGGLRGGANPNDLKRQNFVIAYDWSSGTEVKRIKVPATVEAMAMGPGNDHIAALPDEGTDISLVDLRKGEVGGTVTSTERPLVLAISDDNRWLAVGSKNGQVAVWGLQYRGDANVTTSSLPALGGRIRSNSGTEPAIAAGTPVHLAILSFEAKGVPPDIADMCLSSLSTSLANIKSITLIERAKVAELLKEQQFQSSFMADEATSAKMGRLLNADHVLMCSVGKLGTTLLFTARLLNVETGKVVSGREVICEECRDQDIFDAVKMLASTIAQ